MQVPLGWRVRLREKVLRAVRDGVQAAFDDQAARTDEQVRLAEERAAERHEAVLAALRAWERRQRRDVMTALEQDAARTSGELVLETQGAAWYADQTETLRHALRAAPAEGLVLEFGVASGSTLRTIAAAWPGPVYGFDSFDGLPEHWRLGYDAGAFATDAVPEVPGAELVVGLFEDVLPRFLAEHPGPVAFVHVDCDLYSSTRTVLQHLGDRLVPGTVLLFDEYYNYPGWQEHEHRAWQEHVARDGIA